ncbi:hypothetical protein DERP_011652 [Dermatophagoides pteronyssinus]|uniref:Histone-lysine N-methyltransferase SMYD3-like n=1 Tax=Dermatophagoides pteronyssinus TaxID=6956 RepID=A0ABQ8JWI9_DERPT|nr:hypothetical protein DERP_011652 [Dermatophagoides pteronyssinus]
MIISNRDYKAGNIISCNLPFVHVLNENSKEDYCDYCCVKLIKNSKQQKCDQCKQMFYCQIECKQKDSIKHELECQIYRKYFHIIQSELCRFLLRLYLYAKHYPDSLSNEQYKFGHHNNNNTNNNRCFNDLITHRQEIENDKNPMEIFQTICSKFESIQIEFDREILLEYFCKIRINCFPIFDCPVNKIGSGVYLAESKLNHSCLPNAIIIYDGYRIAIEALESIKSGDEISISYLDLKYPKNIRQKELFRYYYFVCKCQRCEKSDSINCDKLYRLLQKFKQLFDENNWIKSYELGLKIFYMLKRIYRSDLHPELIMFTTMMLKIRVELLSSKTNDEHINQILERNIETNQLMYSIAAYFHHHSSDLMKKHLKPIRSDIFYFATSY